MAGYLEMAYRGAGPRFVMIYHRIGKSLGTFGVWYRVETVDIMNIVPPPPVDEILSLEEREEYASN